MKRLIIVIAAIALSISASAQSKPVSPRINDDRSVTFTCKAPDALTVKISGECVEGKVELVKGEEDLWSYTTPPLKSEMYYYLLEVDGVPCVDPLNSYTVRDANNVLNYFIVPGDPGDLYIPQNVKHGTVSKVWYDSPVLGSQRRMSVYTPAGYEDGNEDYPVLYLLHGMGGDEEAWLVMGRTAQIMDNLIAGGKVKPMIVVMPNGTTQHQGIPGEAGDEGMYVPSFDGAFNTTFEAHFKDVLSYVDSHFRTVKEQTGRAMAGLSMGGEHTFQVALNYPETFSYVGLFSSCARIRKLNGNELVPELYENTESKLDQEFSDPQLKLYYIAIGDKDPLYEMNVTIRNLLDSKGYKYIYNETSGGHTWYNWRLYLADFATRLFR